MKNDLPQYDNLATEAMLRMADLHTDPFVKAVARRLDEASYQLRIYRTMLGLAPEKTPVQLDLFKDN